MRSSSCLSKTKKLGVRKLTLQGIIVQVCNNNASGHPTMIGGMRLAMDEIRKVPAYLCRYRNNIKKIAVGMLTWHLIDTQCTIGLNETMSLKAFGMTFTVATLSEKGTTLIQPSAISENFDIFNRFCQLPLSRTIPEHITELTGFYFYQGELFHTGTSCDTWPRKHILEKFSKYFE